MFRLNKVFLLCALISALLVEKGIYGKPLEEKDPVGKNKTATIRNRKNLM